MALTCCACLGWGAWKALTHLRTRAAGADLESYAAIHQGVIFGALTLVTGSIWGRPSGGIWWTWSSNQLVTFLVLFLFYSAYFMLRYSVEPGPARANMCAFYALFGGVLIPISWLSIRLANDFIPPTVFTRHGPQMSGSMFFTFCVSWAGLLLLAATIYRVELAGQRPDARLRATDVPRRTRGESAGRAPARAAGTARVSSSEKYVAAAYLVVFVGVLAWVARIASKLARLQREVAELVELARRRRDAA